MQRKTLIGLIVLVLVVAVVVWFSMRKNEQVATPLLSVSAFNQTKNTSATSTPASPTDTIVYTLTAENQSDKVISGYIVQVNISDIADKATLLDASGASYDSATNSLVWTPLDIEANQSISKTFSVKVNALPGGTASTTLKITFNNELSITVAPLQAGDGIKIPLISGTGNQGTGYKAPATGPSETVPVVLAMLATIAAIGIRKYGQNKLSLWG